MQPLKRQQFICSAIEQCKETVNCCAHKLPHIKDERCVPRECRYAPGIETVDCEPYPVVKSPAPETVVPIKKEDIVEQVKEEIASVPGIELAGEIKVESVTAHETDIKEAVKKQSAVKKKGGRKKA